MDPWRSLWIEIEDNIRSVLALEETNLPEESVKGVREMLGQGEYGLARDELDARRDEMSAASRTALIESEKRMTDEHALHERALAETDDRVALDLWIELGARGNPDAADRLRGYARGEDAALRDPARAALEAMELSHDAPMP